MKKHQEILSSMLRHMATPKVAEVGVANGATSEILLKSNPSLTLWMIDIWSSPQPSQKIRMNASKKLALERTEFASGRRWVLQDTSVNAAIHLPDGLFDLVFIDACHRQPYVLADCAAYWPTLKSLGVLCGHDANRVGVSKAVQQFCRLVGLRCHVEETVWIIEKS